MIEISSLWHFEDSSAKEIWKCTFIHLFVMVAVTLFSNSFKLQSVLLQYKIFMVNHRGLYLQNYSIYSHAILESVLLP